MNSESPQPFPSNPPQVQHPLQNFFIGPDGLRAGWSVLLFFAFVAALETIWHLIVRQLHLTRGIEAHGPMTWGRVLLSDGGNFAVFALAAWLMSYVERRPFGVYGMAAKRWFGDLLAGLAWGLAALSLLIGCLWGTHLLAVDGVNLHGANAAAFGARWLLAFLLVGFFEEFSTRGYLQYTAARGFRVLVLRFAPDSRHAETIGFWSAAGLLSAALFMFLHTGNPGETLVGILAVGVAGLTFAFSLWRTGTLWWAIGFHAAWDWAQSYLYGVADSGGMVAGHLLSTHPTGSPLLSGGTTGPEGSIFVIPTLALVCLAIHITLPRRTDATIYTQHYSMSPSDPTSAPDPNPAHDLEPRLTTRASATPDEPPQPRRAGRVLKFGIAAAVLIPLLAAGAALGGRHWLRQTAIDALPQIDGSLSVPGLAAPVTIQRDAHGVPHVYAASMDDLILAQGYVTAQDRLWQMDMLRRHAAGELAVILGSKLIAHDRTQRTLQIGAAADRALAALPADQLHWLTVYAQGVNAAMETQLKSQHLPVEFRILHYEPAPWTPRDSMLVSLAMYENLTNAFPQKLAKEALSARLPAQLAADLYPVGSWRDHPPAAGVVDLTIEGPPIEQVPLDESQSVFALNHPVGESIDALRALHASLGVGCPTCASGSNDWVVSGTRTASGKPLLSDDMHLHLGVPDTWYEVGLSGPGEFDVAGVSLPGVPFIIVGHNRHVAWGITYLYADVQDLYIEQTRGSGAATEFQAIDGSWQPVVHHAGTIQVRGGKDVAIDVTATTHGGFETPILTPILPKETRSIALRWTIQDPAAVTTPYFAIDSAHDWPSFTAALSSFGGPGQNVVYADDQGHIGYHAIGRVPIRGPHQQAPTVIPADIAAPKLDAPVGKSVLPSEVSPLAPPGISPAEPKPAVVPTGAPISSVPVQPTAANEWSGYIPFEALPQVFDPAGGVLATANARITPDDYPYRIADNWAAPYRNERIWHTLAAHNKLTATDMLALQNDVYSDFNHVLAQRFAYAIDHSAALAARPAGEQKGLRQAADLMRKWNGGMDADAAAPAVVASAHAALWQILLSSHVAGASAKDDLSALYLWNQKDYALEQIVAHTPDRWLPPAFKSWDDLMASAVDKGLADAHAPSDLSKWRYGKLHPFEIEHPIFALSATLRRLLGWRIGSGAQPMSGDHSTVKQVDRSFGPSERLTVDLADLDGSTLNIVMGESGNPASPWFADQFPAWYKAATFKLPYSEQAVTAATTHTLTLNPR